MIHGSKTPKVDRDKLRTPAYVFEYARQEFGDFDVDLASDGRDSMCTRYMSDSLNQDWHASGFHGWCNPPYSDIRPWLWKAEQESYLGFDTTFLIPSFNGEKWNMLAWDMCTAVRIIVPRVNFLMPDGTPTKSNPRGSMLLHVSKPDYKRADQSKDVSVIGLIGPGRHPSEVGDYA